MATRRVQVDRPELGIADDEEVIDLDRLGTCDFSSGKVVWQPPSDLPPTLAKQLRSEVTALNRLVRQGKVSIARKTVRGQTVITVEES